MALPGAIERSLLASVHADRHPAWLAIDADGNLVDSGGATAHYGLPALTPGAPAEDQVDFLIGLLPPPESPFVMPTFELAGGRAADIRIDVDGDTTWVLLIDVTETRDAARRMQQKAYDMTLLEEKEARLNRELAIANAALQRAQALLQAELDEAAAYVRSILPAPMTHPFRADWRFIPCTSLGGDTFGYHWIDQERCAIYLIDVCGHGVGPSLLSVGVVNTLRSGALPDTDLRAPGQVLSALNDLFQMESHNDLYFTIWYGVYDVATRSLAYGSAGHPPALLFDGPPGTPPTPLKGQGGAIGMRLRAKWPEQTVHVAPGSRLFVLSDGTFEVRRADGSTMELDDLVALLREPCDGADELESLVERLRAVSDATGFEDDFSIIRFAFP